MPAKRKTARAIAFGWLGGLVVTIGLTYIFATGYMYFNQRSFVFVPTGELSSPSDKGLEGVTVEVVPMADGTEVTVWRAPPHDPGAPTVLYFHGNSGNLSARSKRFAQILDGGFGLYAPGYRGYPGSGGSPSEEAFISDALEHFDRLAAAGDPPIILHGESLGTGVATAVAAQRKDVELLVLEAPYTALVDMARASYPWLPVNLLMKDQMPTRERIGKVPAPVLIVHGSDDRLISVEHGKTLYDLANDPKRLEIVEGAGHGNLWDHGLWPAVLETMTDFQLRTRK